MFSLLVLAASPQVPLLSKMFVSGNELYSYCQSASSVDQGICTGYIGGVVDSQITVLTALKLHNPVCGPQNVTTGEMKDIVLRSLREHPEERHYTAASLVLGALAEAFPCTSNTSENDLGR